MRITWTASIAVAVALSSVACSTQTEGDGSPDDGSSGNEGGAGGAAASGGSGGSESPCELDCSTIQTPQCQVAVCDAASKQCQVVPAPDGDGCDDGMYCTVNDSCQAGTCEGGGQNDCGMPAVECTVVTCDEATQTCSAMPADDDTACESDDLCVINSHCTNGLCVGAPKDCFFAPGGECNTLACNPATGKCDPTPDPTKNGATCSSSGDLCMVSKICTDGDCIGGTPKDCSALTQGCHNGVCNQNNGQCFADPINEGEECLEATDACNVGICDAMGLCVATPTNDGAGCEDGNSCTLGETCAAGACQGGSMSAYVAYFTETFASNAAGWTLGSEWEIGSAQESSCGSGKDPAMDHTPSADNGVAGVKIGGCATTTLHDYYYLQSPVVNTDVSGPVWLEFWRVLNSDYTPYMANTVDVFNGTQWVNLWTTGASPGISDTMWTKVSHDLTAHKNAQLRVRFGFKIGSSGVFTKSSWNVDDVTIANQVCN
jgi:hypothetical protein